MKAREPAYAWIGLVEPSGTVLAASGGLLKGVDVSARPWFTGGREREYFGDPHLAKLLAGHMPAAADGEPPRFYDISVPILDSSGQLRGVLGAHLFWDWMRSVVRDSVARRTKTTPLEVLVADREGNWLIQPRTEGPGNLAALQQNSNDADFLVATQQISAQQNTALIGWAVAVRQETRGALGPVHESRQLALMFILALACLIAVGTWFVSGRVVQPILNLMSAARRHAQASGHALPSDDTRGNEAKFLDDTLSRLAMIDSLTGLANRSAFRQCLLAVRADQARTGCPYGILLLDLDDFHVINNGQGLEAGDLLLQSVAARLRQLTGQEHTVARLGSDEFVVLLERLPPDRHVATEQARKTAHRILDGFRWPFDVASNAYLCQASLGIVIVEPSATTPEDAIEHAEMAMQEAKRLGKNQIMVFDDSMHEVLLAQARLEQALRAAIPAQLLVHYQPQVDHQGQVLGAELLVRWQHPHEGMISPARFIPVAERTGAITDIGRWVLEEACWQIKRWAGSAAHQHLYLAVNVSAIEFIRPDFVTTVQRIVERTGANPHRLKLELTESALAMDIEQIVSRMNALRALGVSFALDDFGTGFSSLSYLTRMPIDQLKIDQSFVRELTTSPKNESIVRAVIAVAAGLDLSVIAEGVETEAQRQRLADLGCFHYQGYLFGRPVRIEDLAV